MRHWILPSILIGAIISAPAHAGKAPWEEYGERIKASEKVAPLGSNAFGDEVSLSNGGLSFSATDVSIPGNNGLPVAVGRHYAVKDRRHYAVSDGMFADWDIQLPNISGTFAKDWLVAPSGTNRCSNSAGPPLPSGGYAYSDFWRGRSLEIPGVGGGELLVPEPGITQPATGGPWKWVAGDQIHLSCLTLSGSNTNTTGEGFLAITPDGTKYWFTWMAQQFEPDLRRAQSIQGLSGEVPTARRKNLLYATRVEDRFGNWVTYAYSNAWNAPGRLTAIRSSDGRDIDLTYNANGHIATVREGTRTWTYTYGSTTSGRRTLTQVALPDGSAWQINFSAFTNAEIQYTEVFAPGEMYRTCNTLEIPLNYASEPVGVITHPAGVVGTFRVGIKEHGRSKVTLNCGNYTTPYNDKNDDVNLFPISYHAFTLLSKQVSGPGLDPQSWNYAYVSGKSVYMYPGTTMMKPICMSWNSSMGVPYYSCWAPPCQSNACAGSSTTTVTGPNGEWTRYTYGNTFRYDEGKLKKVESGSVSVPGMRVTTFSYDLNLTDAPGAYPDRYGQGSRVNYDSFQDEYHRPLVSTTITQQAEVFTKEVVQFDYFARPTREVRSSTLGHTRTDETSYQDSTAHWVLGLVRNTYNVDEARFTSQVDFDGSSLLPVRIYTPSTSLSGGQLSQSLTYNSDGTLATVKDGLNNTTTLASWHRGLPQLVTFPDGTTLSTTVDGHGWVTSVTNEVGATTSYSYDALGRITQVAYPTGDPVSWTPTTMSFEKATASAFGLPAGHWRHTTNRGNFRKEVYYDALWRPVIQREWEVGNSTATIRYSGWAHDHANRVTFAGYPRSSASSLASFTAGTSTTYDALGRVTRVEQDSELGDLVTHTEYLAGFKTRVTNPRGHSTTTSYRAFDDPGAAQAYRIEAPGAVVTDIALDLLGKTTALTRSGIYEGVPVSLSRHYVYDSRQRLCKRVEPETGASIFSYDAAGNLAWTAEGQPYTGTTTCDTSSVPASEKTLRSYDSRNRLVLVDYPDSTLDVTTTYTSDGKVATIGRDPTLLSYTYNKLGLLTSERVQKFGAIDWLTSHSYTTLGHLAATTYPSGHQVAFAPNALGQATQAGTYATGAKYHPNGALAEFTYGNGIVHTLTQNLRQLPERSRDALGTNVVLDDSYDYDANGNVAAISDGLPGQPGNRDMAYDELDRLVSVIAGAAQGGNGTFAYDPLDNLRVLDQGSRQFRYAYDVSNRLAEIRSPAGTLLHTFGYDARGNTTNKDGRALIFDRENRMVYSELPTPASYVYDGLGRRVSELLGEMTFFYYSHEGKLLYTTDNKTVTRSEHIYLSGSLVAERRVPQAGGAAVVTYQHTDALGTPVAFTDASGNVTRRERMTAWGEPADGAWTNGPGYTGHQMDAGSKLVYMQQRYYDPATGRFLSVDPVASDPATGWNQNRYNYAASSPYTYVDPDGRRACGYMCMPVTSVQMAPSARADQAPTDEQKEMVAIDSRGFDSREEAAVAFGDKYEEEAKSRQQEPQTGFVQTGPDNVAYTKPLWGDVGDRDVSVKKYTEALIAVYGTKLRGFMHVHFDRQMKFSFVDALGRGNWTYYLRNQRSETWKLDTVIQDRLMRRSGESSLRDYLRNNGGISGECIHGCGE